MKEYHDLVHETLLNGEYTFHERTQHATIRSFAPSYQIDLSKKIPLLTTKRIWYESAILENGWYYSGEHHIRNFSKASKIWDAWQDDNGNLTAAYGRFWRRMPLPALEAQLPGEHWERDTNKPYVNEEENGVITIDQLAYASDLLQRDSSSRRAVISAWHPGNAVNARLPPCHVLYVFQAVNGKLNLHLTQRSGDIALGIPFNEICYAITDIQMAKEVGLQPGKFSHTIVDAHIYSGTGKQADWWQRNLHDFQERLGQVTNREDYLELRDWLITESPDHKQHDHVSGLLLQLSRKAYDSPTLEVLTDTFDQYAQETIGRLRTHDGPISSKLKKEISDSVVKVENYKHHDQIKFSVAV